MTAQPARADELRLQSGSAGLQRVTPEKAGEVLSLEWGSGGIFDVRVERVFKVRCIQPCRGHVGYVFVATESPRPGETFKLLAFCAAQDASRNAWIARQDERWREKYQITGRERVATPIPNGGQRWAKFVPLDGWKSERGLWQLTARAVEQQERGYPISGRRSGGPFKHMSEEQIADSTRGHGPGIGSNFVAELRRSTMIPDFGQTLMEDRLRLFPVYARCTTRGCHRILRIEPCLDALD